MKTFIRSIMGLADSRTTKKPDSNPADKALQAFEAWVESGRYLTPRINLAQVASETGLTIHELRHLCTSQYGCPFSRKLKMLRIEYACRILTEHPEIPISAIGMMTGIEDRSNFRKEFKSITGMYPQEWRNRQ